MRIPVAVGVVVAILLVPATAHAKGPDSATIEGAGLAAPIAVDGNHGGSSFTDLREEAGFMPAAFRETPDPMMRSAPTSELGPKLVITWRVPAGEAPISSIRQDVYPFADGGPLVYTAPGQPFLQTEHTYGGWYRALPALTASLERLGVPAPAAKPVPAAKQLAPDSTWTTPLLVVSAVALGAGALATIGLTALARRRRRVVPA
jgi:hypothetical protein